MTPRLSHIVAGAILAIGVVFGALIGIAHVAQKISGKAEASAKIEEKKADAHADAAKVSDKQVEDIKTKLDIAQTNLDRITSERDALLRKIKQPPSPGPVALPPLPAIPSDTPDVRDAVIAKDAEVIASQKSVIEQQDAEIKGLVTSRDQWKAAYSDEKRSNVGLQIALDVQKVVSSSNKWVYRAQGLVIGFGVGYVAGRLH